MSDAESPTWARALEAFNREGRDPQVRTIVCPLGATSNRKRERVRSAIDEWQAVALRTAQLLPSFHENQWHLENTQVRRTVLADFPDRRIAHSNAAQAVRYVIGRFKSWRSKDHDGDTPQGEWGEAEYAELPARMIDVEANAQGYGVRLRLEPKYGREDGEDGHVWFRIDAAEYHDQWLERVVDEDDPTTHGAGTLRIGEEGGLRLELTVKSETDVLASGAVENWVGVDLGENNLYALAVTDARSGEVEQVEVESGREYRHHRERLKRKRKRRAEKGDFRGVKACKGDIEKYTRHVLHAASREIIDVAENYDRPGIRLEDLSGIHEGAEAPFADQPYSKFRQFIEYKAEAAGIPVDVHGAWFTTSLCNKCGEHTEVSPRADHFRCKDCPEWDGDYLVNRDVNAAINISRRITPPAELMQAPGGTP